MTQQREWASATFRGHFEAPDLLVATFSGHVDLEGARQASEMYRQAAEQGPCFALIDITGSTISADARDHFVKTLGPEWFRAVIYVGAGVVQRTMTKAMTLAFYFTGKWKTEFHFADSEAEARALVAKLREKQRAPHSASGTR